MKIKYLQELSVPKERKRDGEITTHRICINLTTDEAIMVSEMFERNRQAEDAPKISLIRAALMVLAEEKADEAVIAAMVKYRTKTALAEKLSKSEVDRALNFLSQPAKPAPVPVPVSVAKERRVFIPEPRRR